MAKKDAPVPDNLPDSPPDSANTPPAANEGEPAAPDQKGGKKKKVEKLAKPKAKPAKAPGARGSKKPKSRKITLRFTRRSFLLKLVVRIATFFFALSRKLKIERVRMKGLKPPFIILCTHQSFTDYAIVERVAAPFDVNHICEVSEFVDSESLMNSLGCIPLRRFVADSKLLFHLRETLLQKKVAALYPEAHFSFDGSDSPLPDVLFKILKTLAVPVVVVKVRGTYISHPCWSSIDHKTPLEAVVTQVFSANEIKSADEETVKNRILSAFRYDDLWWQLQASVQISSPRRAEGLENILYLCPVCHQEYGIRTKGNTITCSYCNQSWVLSESLNLSMVEGSLHHEVLDGLRAQQAAVIQNELDKKALKKAQEEYKRICRQHEMARSEYERARAERDQMHEDAVMGLIQAPVFDSELVDPGPIPTFVPPPPSQVHLPPPEPPPDISRIRHWFDFQRETLAQTIRDGNYSLELPVQVELLENISRGFMPLGAGMLEHSAGGFLLSYRDRHSGRKAVLAKNPLATYSCHVDFDYNGKGAFIDLSTSDQTFYLYPETELCSVTKIALAAEEFYRLAQELAHEKEKESIK